MKKTLLSLLFTTTALATQAQRYLGTSTSNTNALSSMYLNPANIAGCKEKLSIQLVSFNVGVDNSLGTISSVGDISKTVSSGDSSSSNNIFKFGNNNKFSMMVPAVDMRLPAILYRINSKNSLALAFRVRGFNEFNNFDKTLYSAVTDPNFSNQSTINASAQSFNWTAHFWAEAGLTYGRVLMDEGPFRLKAGATLRYLVGIGYLGIKGKNIDISYTSGSDSFRANNTDIEYASNIGSIEDGASNGFTLSSIFNGPSKGRGFSIDLGTVFEYRPDEESEDYKAAVSASITDMGSINYANSYNVVITGNGYLTGKGLENNVKNYDDLRTYAKTQGFTLDTGVKAQRVYLPTTLIISADYQIRKHIFVNATFFGNMASDANFGSKYYSQLSVTPRYDRKIFSVGIPLTYNMLTKNMRFGLGARITGFYFGSDDMAALFSGNQYGFNFYVGAMVPIYKTGKKDKDRYLN